MSAPVNKALLDISVMHPSKYLSHDDLQGRQVTVKIESVSIDAVQMSDGSEEFKTVLTFEKVGKSLIGGKTNDYSIAVLISRKPLDWVGKRIVLIPGVTTFGKPDPVPCVRIGGSPDATPERAKAFDQCRAQAASVELKKQSKRFMAELKRALAKVDPIKLEKPIAVPKLEPEAPAESAETKTTHEQKDIFAEVAE